MDKITVKAYAKINLSLDITGKRDDGYHLLRTVMQSISICDIITITKTAGEEITISCDNPAIPLGEKNIVYKTAKMFFAETGKSSGLDIAIEKHIPHQAGMGGGSADAAAMLVALNTLFDAGLTTEKLCDIGVELGADVPFCIEGGTALCEGIGEIITPLAPLKNCTVLISKPKKGIPTVEAFRVYDSLSGISHPDVDAMIDAINNGAPYAQYCKNVLEFTALLAELDEIKSGMKAFGAVASCMTGSGSAVYGLFDNELSAKECYAKLRTDVGFAEICHPVNHGCEII